MIPVERNNASIYAAEIFRYPRKNLIYLDESGFSSHTRRYYGYSVENTDAHITVPGNRGTNVTLMCVIGNHGVIAKETRKGAYKSEKLIIKGKLKPYFRVNRNTILIMGKASIHHSRTVLDFCRKNMIVVKFLPHSLLHLILLRNSFQ